MRSNWRFFPQAVVAALGLVVVVNAGMIYAALHSFPGPAAQEDFALSNRYDAVLDRVQQETALGWTLSAWADASGRAEVTLVDRSGAPLQGATVAASAERPLGARKEQVLAFREAAPGHYVAGAALPEPGQWELTLSASFDGHDIAASRRVIVH